MTKFKNFVKICDLLKQYNEERVELYKLIAEVVNHIRNKINPYNSKQLEYHTIECIGILNDFPDICTVTLNHNYEYCSIYFPVKFLCDDFKTKYAKEIDEFVESHLKNNYYHEIKHLEEEIKIKQKEVLSLNKRLSTFQNANDDMVKLIDTHCLEI